MNKTIIAVIFVIAVVAFLVLVSLQKDTPSEPESLEITITPIEHASAILSAGNQVIYTDPAGDLTLFDSKPVPTVILITDIHGDHLDTAVLEALSTEETTIIMPQAVADKLPAEGILGTKIVLANGGGTELGDLTVMAVPMYNLPEGENKDFHTKGRGNGYLINMGQEIDPTRIYISGDSAGTPEMRALEGVDIALVAMNLPYTMDVEEAASAVLDFAPGQVYPYHFRGENGFSDIAKFKTLVNAGNPDIQVVELDWYPQN